MIRWLGAGNSICHGVKTSALSRRSYIGPCSWINFSTSAVRLVEGEPDFDAARKWRSQVGTRPIASSIGELSYARSSGAGGQHVNTYVLTSADRHC